MKILLPPVVYKLFTYGSLVLVCACAISIKGIEVPTAKTDLEKQVLGEYRSVDNELILMSTVRGKKLGLLASNDPVELAKQNQKFNQDDLEELKNLQILGEGNDGKVRLVPLSISKIASPKAKIMRLARIILDEENSDRMMLWQDTLAKGQKSLSLVQVQKTYMEAKRKQTTVGQWYQDDKGTWIRKASS
ncbi:MAG: DUF1318 domain-containing protein [Oligoflexales bacterium]|nr:DUF1318 domain-containing protein [Oligoflexales bacterium]